MINKNYYKNNIEQIKLNITGVLIRELLVKDKTIEILYIPQITNREALSENIIKPLLEYSGEKDITEDVIIKCIIYFDQVFCDDEANNMEGYILDGNSIITISGCEKYIVANTVYIKQRTIQSPEVESAIRTPRDCFNENMDSNISLIRYRIKDPTLKIDYYVIGKRTKTTVGLVYIKDVVNPKYVEELEKMIRNINVDGILDSGNLQKFIVTGNQNLFPEVGVCERSDSACAHILDGKVCVLVSGSNLALIAPKTFIEFFDCGDDHYDNTYFGMFLKLLRFIAVIISLTLSALYVAIVGFHPDFLPAHYILALAVSRVGVPVNSVLEATFMEILLELLREANQRLPQKIGTAIGIVGAIVIGQALVSAGLVSSPMIIIVSLSSLASYAVPDFTIMHPIKLLKFPMIFLTGMFGLFGFIMGLSVILIKLTSITSFGVPYTAPLSPFNFTDIKNFVFSNVARATKRAKYLHLKDRKRS